jgi:FdhD protein
VKPFEPEALPAGVRAARVVAWRSGTAREHADWLADEVPVALVFNGITQAVMLATPSDLGDFALGFALTEGFLECASELRGVEAETVAGGIALHLGVSAACEWRLRGRRRQLAGRTGCGLCGADSLAAVRLSTPALEPVALEARALARAQRELRRCQAVQHLTGATHAAAWCAKDGSSRIVREDVGRHNALDKVIGAMVAGGSDPADGFLCVTSRASFEMVQKCARAGVATLAAVSAPTALAVSLAAESGVLLAGFVRGDDLVAYTFPGRLGAVAAEQ